jgi:MFS family permease
MSGINAMEAYRRYFGLPIHKGTPATGIVYGIYTIGNLLGSFVAGPATDFRGLRMPASCNHNANSYKAVSGECLLVVLS